MIWYCIPYFNSVRSQPTWRSNLRSCPLSYILHTTSHVYPCAYVYMHMYICTYAHIKGSRFNRRRMSSKNDHKIKLSSSFVDLADQSAGICEIWILKTYRKTGPHNLWNSYAFKQTRVCPNPLNKFDLLTFKFWVSWVE